MAITNATYICAKCRHTGYETDEFHATGGNFAKIFDMQNQKFTTLSCKQCGYIEIYRAALQH
jgi:predicted nucleic-acid-binding Zn-ribbon protein